MANPASPGILLPQKIDERGLATVGRTLERRLNGPGISGSIVQEKIFSGACTSYANTNTASAQILTGIPSPINFTKLFPGTTIRIKFSISFFNGGTAGSNGSFRFFASISPNTSIQFIGHLFQNNVSVHMSTQAFLFDFSAATYNNANTGKANTTGVIPLYFYTLPINNVGTNQLNVDGNDWYNLTVDEVAP